MKISNAGARLPASYSERLNAALDAYKEKTGTAVNFRQLTMVMVSKALELPYKAVPKYDKSDTILTSYGVTDELRAQIEAYSKKNKINKTQFLAFALSQKIDKALMQEVEERCVQAEQTQIVSFRTTKELDERLDKAAAQLSVSKTAVILRGLDMVLNAVPDAPKSKKKGKK